jgi:hypothetical protein
MMHITGITKRLFTRQGKGFSNEYTKTKHIHKQENFFKYDYLLTLFTY